MEDQDRVKLFQFLTDNIKPGKYLHLLQEAESRIVIGMPLDKMQQELRPILQSCRLEA